MLTHKETSNNKRKLDEAYYNRSISEFKKLTVNLTIGMGIAALEINILGKKSEHHLQSGIISGSNIPQTP